MGGTNGLKETTLSVNVFTAPGQAMVGDRSRIGYELANPS